MRKEVFFSGFGGQGVIFVSVIFGRVVVVYEGFYVVQIQVYGLELRGGVSKVEVVISDELIDYFKIFSFDYVVFFFQEVYIKYFYIVKEGVKVIVEKDFVLYRDFEFEKNFDVLVFLFIEIVEEIIGLSLMMNIFVFGVLIVWIEIVSREVIEKVVFDVVLKGMEQINLRVFYKGFEFGEKVKRGEF